MMHRLVVFKHQDMIVMAAYPDLDAGASGSTQPVAVGAEAEGIDGVTAVQGVKVLAFVQVPQHGLTVLQRKHWDAPKTKLELSFAYSVTYLSHSLYAKTHASQ